MNGNKVSHQYMNSSQTSHTHYDSLSPSQTQLSDCSNPVTMVYSRLVSAHLSVNSMSAVELYLVKVNPIKGRLFPKNPLRSLEGRSGNRSSLAGSKTSKLEVSSRPVTEGM